MSGVTVRWAREGLMVVALASVALLAPGCGCDKRDSDEGSVAQLKQLRMRYTPDARGATCYLVAEVENTGDKAVREAKAVATLKNGRGKKVGENNHFLEDVPAGERVTFSMTISAAADFRTVELALVDPNAPPTQPEAP